MILIDTTRSDRHLWVCPECNYRIDWSYAILAEQGNPVCPDCDCDMEWEGSEK